jgi:hypothetical protein
MHATGDAGVGEPGHGGVYVRGGACCRYMRREAGRQKGAGGSLGALVGCRGWWWHATSWGWVL